MGRPRASLLAVLVGGLSLLAIGVVLARILLPEWQPPALSDESFYRDSQRAVAERLGVRPESTEALVLLVTSEVESLPAGAAPADGAGSWARGRLNRGDPGLLVRVTQPVGWHGVGGGQLVTDFTPEGQLRGMAWQPLHFSSFFQLTVARSTPTVDPHGLADLLLAPGEHRQTTPVEGSVGGMEVSLFALVGEGRGAEHLRVGIASGLAMEARRQAGTAEQGRHLLEHHTFSELWQRLALRALLFLLVAGLFLVLFFQRRIDFRDGLVLAGLAFLVSSGSLLSQVSGGVSWWQALSMVGFATLFLILLWSVSESWIRTTEVGFTTSLDLLRAGRLGPRGGRALVAGWGWGLGLAGLRLTLHSAAASIPGLVQIEPSFWLPVFRATGHPFYRGPMVAGIVLLAIAAAHRLLERRWRALGATVLAALLLVPTAEQGPLGLSLLAGGAVAGLLVACYRRYGLAALLTASLVSLLVPPAVHGSLVLQTPSHGARVAQVVLLLLPVIGWLGLRRSLEREAEALVPHFVQRVENERRFKYEMELLARMQRGLLPGRPPQVAGWVLVAESFLATEAGGDLYDFVVDRQGRLWVAVGDVAGHGYSCAIELAMVKASLHSLITAKRRPSQVLQRIDEVLRSSRSVRSFTSLALIRLDPASGEMMVSNAGHPYPLLLGSGGLEEIELPSLPLGQGPPRLYVDQTRVLALGETLVVFSDGLVEAVDEAGRAFGFERVKRVLVEKDGAGRDVQQLFDRLIADWCRHRSLTGPHDDTTLVLLHRLEASDHPRG